MRRTKGWTDEGGRRMTRIDIVGVGLGPATLTREASDSIARAGLLVGSPRLIEEHAPGGRQAVAASRPEDVVEAVRQSDAEHVAVLMSGDVGFHSGAAIVFALLSDEDRFEARLVAGVATPVLFAARLGIPWDDACLVSCHGTGTDLVAPVRRHRHTFALTGGNVPELARTLADAGYGGLTVWAGEDLGLDGERVTQATVDGLPHRPWSSLTVLMIDNPGWDDRVRAGIPDDEFTRGDVPMTKQAIRAQALSLLGLRPADVCYDIGCGTGSVSVEMALAAHAGHVWALDKNPDAIGLTQANCRAFHVGNVTVAHGTAPEALAGWPAPDVVFVGGTSGDMNRIVATVVDRNPAARIVITAIAVESASAAIRALGTYGIEPEVTQVSVACGRAAGGLHLLMAQNPVTIVSGGGHG